MPSSTSDDSTSLERELERRLDRISELMRRVIRTVRIPDESVELTPTQVVVLFHLSDRDGLRIGALAQALGAAQNTVSEVVSRLVRSGLVVKERDPDDNRAVIVRLSAKGKSALERHQTILRRSHRKVLQALSMEEQQRFLESFEVLVRMAERARAASTQERVRRKK